MNCTCWARARRGHPVARGSALHSLDGHVHKVDPRQRDDGAHEWCATRRGISARGSRPHPSWACRTCAFRGDLPRRHREHHLLPAARQPSRGVRGRARRRALPRGSPGPPATAWPTPPVSMPPWSFGTTRTTSPTVRGGHRRARRRRVGGATGGCRSSVATCAPAARRARRELLPRSHREPGRNCSGTCCTWPTRSPTPAGGRCSHADRR